MESEGAKRCVITGCRNPADPTARTALCLLYPESICWHCHEAVHEISDWCFTWTELTEKYGPMPLSETSP